MEGIINKITNIAFNNDYSCFACATTEGFNVYSTSPLKEILKRGFSFFHLAQLIFII